MNKPSDMEVCSNFMDYVARKVKDCLMSGDDKGFRRMNVLLVFAREQWLRETKAEFEKIKNEMVEKVQK